MVVNDPAPPDGAALARTQPGIAPFVEFVRGTTSEMVSEPVSLTAVSGMAGLLSTGLIAAGVVPPTPVAQLPAVPPTGVLGAIGMPNPACLMSLAINSMATRTFCCVPTARSFEIVALCVVVRMVYPPATMTDEITIAIISSMSVNPRSHSTRTSFTSSTLHLSILFRRDHCVQTHRLRSCCYLCTGRLSPGHLDCHGTAVQSERIRGRRNRVQRDGPCDVLKVRTQQ